jgi:hypothetical protein
MSRMLAAAALLSAALAAPAVAGVPTPDACPGRAIAALEEGFPREVRRVAFDGSMLEPFMKLWSAARRPHLPAPPERVTVYVVPEYPYLVGYQRQGCVIAFLTVERQKLWQLLRPQLGWPA